MPKEETILRFEKLSFNYGHNHPILIEADFSVRKGSKITLMGQNGAGKSTIFQLIEKKVRPESGDIHLSNDFTIATAKQVIPRDQMDITVREFFEKCFNKKIYDIDPKIDKVLDIVNLKGHEKLHDRKIKSFSGGQQARLLLASALIQDPDILLLDEPTNNLDAAGIKYLTDFLINYKKTCIVISHDADFLNSFSNGVLYLDIFTRKMEQYVGNYFDVVREISARVEKENRKNAQLAKEIQKKKDKANFFAKKGGQMRLVAKKMKEKAEELEEEKMNVRKEDKAIKFFTIPSQPEVIGNILRIKSYKTIKNHKPVSHKSEITLKKNQHLLISGPNGIGKTTLLETIASGKDTSVEIADGIRLGYYRQDFSTLNFEDTVGESLFAVMDKKIEETMRATAAGFLITSEIINTKIGKLSEGQKGLVAFARLVLQKPGLLVLDEPTNHINFRHLPIIAESLNKYDGAMILVSHAPEFVKQVRIDEILDLKK